MLESDREYTTRKTCRVCDTPLSQKPIFSLGDHYVNNFVEARDTSFLDQFDKCPIELALCDECGLLQQLHTAPQELLYKGTYWYKSGTTQTMRDALRDVVKKACSLHERLGLGDVVLDIGSNDGTLLREYPEDVTTIGFEPAKNLAEEGKKDVDIFVNDFWSWFGYCRTAPHVKPDGSPFDPNKDVGQFQVVKAKVITALGMFYDLEDPNEFIGDVAKALHPEGIFIAQLMCLHNMISQCDVGNLCHEHLEFYSLKSLKLLYEQNGLEIFNIETNNVNGESYRIYAQLKGGPRTINQVVKVKLESEHDMELRLERFFRDIQESKRKVVSFIREQVTLGKTVWVYGASTKGNTILQYYGLTEEDIVAAADKDPNKHGKYTIGTNIPIKSEEEFRQAAPDYALVLPYAFVDEFKSREEEWAIKGGQFIVPLPIPMIIKAGSKFWNKGVL